MDPATSTVEALNQILDALNLLAFMQAWGLIVGAAVLGAVLGWKLWKG